MCKVGFDSSTNKCYSHGDMGVLNLLKNPIWVFDFIQKKKWWANSAALEFWNSPNLEELYSRDFSKGMSETAHRKNLSNLERLKRNESWTENWTFFPTGEAKSVQMCLSAIRIENGQVCCLIEAREADRRKPDQEFLRDASMLRYLPLAVSQFNNDGKLMYQNPEADIVFGSPCRDEASTNNETKTISSTDETETSTRRDGSHDNSSSNEEPSSTGKKGSCTEQPENPKAVKPTTNNEDTTTDMQTSLDRPKSTTKACNRQTKSTGESASSKSSSFNNASSSEEGNTTIDSNCQSAEQMDLVRPNNHFLDRFLDKSVGLKLYQQIKAGQDVNVEALVNTKTGPAWNAIQARLGHDAVSKDPIILFSARDISDIIQAKKETQLNLERAEFFAVMAHEIRTPMFQVTGFIDLLDQTNLSKDQKEYVKLLKTSAMSLMTVINDVLDYSKLEAGKMKLDIVPFEPKAVVEGCLAAVAVSTEEKGLMLKNSFATGVPVKLQGDPNRLRQILMNLLQNAVKFTHVGGIEASVGMVAKDELGQVLLRFCVKDTGIGIESEHVSNIFSSYNQATPGIAATYGGTGLGLAICKSLVECMGGSIGVDSVVGKGSTFWFEVPFSHTKFKSQHSQSSEDESKIDVGNLQILVAEDNGVSQKLITKMLGRLGHTAKIVENGEEAVKEVQQQDYDLVLMDMQMPIMDGIDATKEIRCLGMQIPIVGLTASVRIEDFENIGLNDWIGKPVRLKELQKKLSSIAKQ